MDIGCAALETDLQLQWQAGMHHLIVVSAPTAPCLLAACTAVGGPGHGTCLDHGR
jgi:hypothetical protein